VDLTLPHRSRSFLRVARQGGTDTESDRWLVPAGGHPLGRTSGASAAGQGCAGMDSAGS